MRTWTFAFLAVAIIAGGLTFSGLSESVSNIAKGVYFVFMLLVAASVLLEPEDLETIRRPTHSAPPRSTVIEPAGAAVSVAHARTGIDVR